MDHILKSLQGITWLDTGRLSYEVMFHLVNSQDFGLPQNRDRVYFVGVHRERCAHRLSSRPLRLPGGLNVDGCKPDLMKFLGNPSPVKRKSLPTSTTARRNILLATKELRRAGWKRPSDVAAVVDLGSGRGLNMKVGCCPTITRCRGGARDFWVTCLGRRLSVWELLRLQGATPEDMDFQVLTEREVGHVVGNAMSAAPSAPMCCLLRPRSVAVHLNLAAVCRVAASRDQLPLLLRCLT